MISSPLSDTARQTPYPTRGHESRPDANSRPGATPLCGAVPTTRGAREQAPHPRACAVRGSLLLPWNFSRLPYHPMLFTTRVDRFGRVLWLLWLVEPAFCVPSTLTGLGVRVQHVVGSRRRLMTRRHPECMRHGCDALDANVQMEGSLAVPVPWAARVAAPPPICSSSLPSAHVMPPLLGYCRCCRTRALGLTWQCLLHVGPTWHEHVP